MLPPITGFWGKLIRDDSGVQVASWLPLADHCVDVASVFRELVELPALNRALQAAAGRSLSAVQLDRLAVLALLHDIGKCNWGFQGKADPRARERAGHVREVAALLYERQLAQRFAEAVGLESLASWFQDGADGLVSFLIVAISHHGEPAFTHEIASSGDLRTYERFWTARPGMPEPIEGIRELIARAQEAFPQAFSGTAEPIPCAIELQHRLAGLISLADWLGSHRERYFPYEHTGNRVQWARIQARHALRAVGLDPAEARAHLRGSLPPFAQVFGFEPRPLQALLYSAEEPHLLVAESETGSGKTEAALGHFLALFAAGEVDSLYYALPTRVAARELYERVRRYAQAAFGEHCPPVLLAVPGYAQIDGESAECLPDARHLWPDDEYLRRRERSWAAERPKRFLAAPIAVGTIDQALLSVMRTAHAQLRSVCLDRALLVVDEVHASDLYTRTLLRCLLEHHLRIGGRALLLSATLGCAAKSEFLALTGFSEPTLSFHEARLTPYPALSAPGRFTPLDNGPESSRKCVFIEPVEYLTAPAQLVPLLRDAVERGERVLVVLNTVSRAIALTREAEFDSVLAPALFRCEGISCPHHGRFARADRVVLDRSVSERLGRQAPAGPVLLIGTQTLEQSLDIDADWLVSDLCPADVLLQRIGRLHRHRRDGRSSPARCTVLVPPAKSLEALLDEHGNVYRGAPAGLGSVYADLRPMELTRELIGAGITIEIPRDNRWLVEAATHPERLGQLDSPRWRAHAQMLEGIAFAHGQLAHGALIAHEPFGELRFPRELPERLVTRLGLEDRRIALPQQFPSPFGQQLEELSIPGHMARGIETDVPEEIEMHDGVLRFRLGERRFQYSRYGLERAE